MRSRNIRYRNTWCECRVRVTSSDAQTVFYTTMRILNSGENVDPRIQPTDCMMHML